MTPVVFVLTVVKWRCKLVNKNYNPNKWNPFFDFDTTSDIYLTKVSYNSREI